MARKVSIIIYILLNMVCVLFCPLETLALTVLYMCACLSFWKRAAVGCTDAEQQSAEQGVTAAAAWRPSTATATSSSTSTTTTAAAAAQYPPSTASHCTAATVHATGNKWLRKSRPV